MALPLLSVPKPARRRIVNVASIPLRSPFRYPGGKTWLIPYVRDWLRSVRPRPEELIEPFAGGGIVALTAVFEKLVDRAVLVELDHDVASVWQTIINGPGKWLADTIAAFQLSRANVQTVLEKEDQLPQERAFATILRNRISRGGIMAPGAGIIKRGENGKGLGSRWYPKTLRKRILDIVAVRERFSFIEGDGIRVVEDVLARPSAVFFVDPPYTVAGRRLYTESEMDHAHLFHVMSRVTGEFLMTYDDAPEVRALAGIHGFAVGEVAMKNTHHQQKTELLISRDLGWLR